MKHQVVVYRYMGVDHPQNGVRQIFKIDGQYIHSLTQIRTKYLAVSLDKETRIYDVISGTVINVMQGTSTYQLLAQVTPKGHRFDFDLVAEAFIGYSYKNYYSVGITLEKGPILQDFQFKAITEMALKRKQKVFTGVGKHAIISAC